jgi:hypothetical protein
MRLRASACLRMRGCSFGLTATARSMLASSAAGSARADGHALDVLGLELGVRTDVDRHRRARRPITARGRMPEVSP